LRRAFAERLPRGNRVAAPNDPTADSIEPPVAGGKPAGDAGVADELPTPAPPPSDDGKVAILSPRRPTS
jgi:hypothetical protein